MVDARVDTLEASQSAVQSEVQLLRAGQARMEEQLRLANSNALTREEVDSDVFDRPMDLSIIRISSPKFATKVAIEDAITPWLTNAGVSRDQWTLSGNTTGRKFNVNFLLNPLSAARLVGECLAALKDDNGKWIEIFVTLVSRERVKLFVGADENDKAGVQRRMAKALIRAINEVAPHVEEVHFRKRKNSVFAGKVGISSMAPSGPNPSVASFLWNHQGLDHLGLDRALLLTKTLKFMESPEDQIPWSL
jgi:hypothetical protein